jgi:hypothetical protein
MYFQSSSYVSNSLGIKYDNAWPKASGTGTLTDPYVQVHTTSSEGSAWFLEQVASASVYDSDNLNELSQLLPEHIREDDNNAPFLKFTDMIGHHFDNIWVYIKAMNDITDRREKLDEGISKDLVQQVAKSMGMELGSGNDLVIIPEYLLGKGADGSDKYETPQEELTEEIWKRILTNMPFFMK